MFENLRERLTREYRIALFDNESLSQTRTLVVKPLTIILFVLGGLFFVSAGTASLMIFSPVNRLLPGAPDPEMDAKFFALNMKLDTLEALSVSQQKYIEVLQQATNAEYDPNAIPEVNPVEHDAPPLHEMVANHEENHAAEENGEQALSVPEEANLHPGDGNSMNLIPPVDGYLSNEFTWKDKHFGVDIVARENSPIKSVAAGFVIFSEYSDETGYVVGISHGDDLITFYKHNSMVFKDVGDYVFSGEAIAVIGNSGQNSSGPHLHFELWHKGQPRDPLDYLTFN